MADKIATRAAYGEFLVEKGREREDLIVMDADLSGSTKTKGFAKAYPERFVNCGIAEQDLMAEAAGIASFGAHCVLLVHSLCSLQVEHMKL